MWRKLPYFRAEKKAWNPVSSLAVMFFGPEIKIFENDALKTVPLGQNGVPFRILGHRRTDVCIPRMGGIYSSQPAASI